MTFDDADIADVLNQMSEADLDALPFGVIRMDANNIVEFYSAWESRLSGLSKERVVGRPFFSYTAPCMNNPLVLGRMEAKPHVDVTIPYMLAFRMRPVTVRLRLLRSPGSASRWVLVSRG